MWDTRHLSFLPRKVAVALSTLALRAGQTAMITVPDLASSRKEPRSEPLARAAVPCTPYPPAYVAKLRTAWRVVVPVRGRLSPRVIARAFPSQSAALSWLATEEGQSAVASERSGRQQQSA